ncbi:Uncharacterised protein [Bordetella pertussis]|nr:Uncharacterised protein [Bordetella pertussis]CFW31120.1 Uncharacterised protein [Bordetella pertussis]
MASSERWLLREYAKRVPSGRRRSPPSRRLAYSRPSAPSARVRPYSATL